MISETEYYGWNAVQIRSGSAILTIPLDIGPRIIACSLDAQANLFHNVKSELGGKGEPDWHLRGGHRLWHSPEAKPRTYDPDNKPVVFEKLSGSHLSLKAPGPDPAGMAKAIAVEALGDEAFKVSHTLTNAGLWPVACAPWAPTVMEYGGTLAIPLLPKESHESTLLPKYTLVPWTYTDFSLPCWHFHRDFIRVESSLNKVPQKIGLSDYPGWSAYWQEAGTFFKYTTVHEDFKRPGFGCCYEAFSNDFMTELETLAPLATLDPGMSTTHIEYWLIKGGLPQPESDASFEQGVASAARDWIARLPIA